MLCAGLIVYQTLCIPLRISFNIDDNNGILDLLDFILDIIFLLDIIMNFNTGYYHKGKLILHRKAIVLNYIKLWFWIDLIASFPYSWLIGINIIDDEDPADHIIKSAALLKVIRLVRFLKVLRLIRVFKLKKIFNKFENLINASPIVNTILGFLKISLIILAIAHWIACLWHYIGSLESDQSPINWISNVGIIEAPWIEKYITSIYWAVTTMITVGYGDIVPVTELEMIVVIFIELISSGIFAFSMTCINDLLTNLESTTISYRQTICAISHYMKKRQVNKEVQLKVKKYLEYTLDNETTKLDEENLIGLLSDNLRRELIAEINGKILAQHKLFAEQFSQKFLMQVAYIMKEKIFGADEIILKEYDTYDLSIYFIVDGNVEIFSIQSGSILQKLGKSNCFGELSFFTGIQRTASAKSTSFTELRCISREDFLRVLDRFPDDKEKYFIIKDQINLYNNYSSLGIICYSCNSPNHIALTCPIIHYQKNQYLSIQQYLQAETKFHQGFKRPFHRLKLHTHYLNTLAQAARRIQLIYGDNSRYFHENLNKRYSNYYELCGLPEFNSTHHHHHHYYRNDPKDEHGASSTEDIVKLDMINQVSANEMNEKSLRNNGKKTTIITTPTTNTTTTTINMTMAANNNMPIESNRTKKMQNMTIKLELNLWKGRQMNSEIKYFNVDSVCEYKHYFPHNNFKNVLYQIKKNNPFIRRERLFFHEEKSPVRQKESPIRQKESPIRQKESPIRQKESPIRQKESPIRQKESPIRQKESLTRQKESPIRQEESPLGSKDSPSNDKKNPFCIKEKPIYFKRGSSTKKERVLKRFFELEPHASDKPNTQSPSYRTLSKRSSSRSNRNLNVRKTLLKIIEEDVNEHIKSMISYARDISPISVVNSIRNQDYRGNMNILKQNPVENAFQNTKGKNEHKGKSENEGKDHGEDKIKAQNEHKVKALADDNGKIHDEDKDKAWAEDKFKPLAEDEVKTQSKDKGKVQSKDEDKTQSEDKGKDQGEDKVKVQSEDKDKTPKEDGNKAWREEKDKAHGENEDKAQDDDNPVEKDKDIWSLSQKNEISLYPDIQAGGKASQSDKKVLGNSREFMNMIEKSLKEHMDISIDRPFEAYMPLLEKIIRMYGKDLIFKVIEQKKYHHQLCEC